MNGYVYEDYKTFLRDVVVNPITGGGKFIDIMRTYFF